MASVGKTIAAKLHLWLGLGSGLVVFVAALTGSILVFEEELEPLLSPRFFTVSVPEQSQRASLDQLVSTVTTAFPGKKVVRIVVEPHPDRTMIVELLRSKKAKENPKDVLAVALNPYTSAIVGSRAEQDAFFPVVLRLHRYLCLGETGKIITGISCSMFLVIWPTKLIAFTVALLTTSLPVTGFYI